MFDPRTVFEKRNFGEIRVSAIRDSTDNLDRVLSRFGLVANQADLVEHDRNSAIAILKTLLWKDMAYDDPCMPEADAKALALEIVSTFERPDCKYFSNGNWSMHESWNPFTDSTFDSGLIIDAKNHQYFCIWFQDED